MNNIIINIEFNWNMKNQEEKIKILLIFYNIFICNDIGMNNIIILQSNYYNINI